MSIFAETGVMWVFDTIEERFGLAAAWLVATTLTFIFIGGIIAILAAIV